MKPAGKPFPRLATLHRWLGVGLGLWFVLVGLSGSLLVWREAIDAWLNPQWFQARAAGPALDAERIAEMARTTHALGRIERVRPPPASGGVYRLQIRAAASRVESGRIEAFIDPADGALLGVRSLEAWRLEPAHAMRLLYEFHRNLLLGEPGSNFVGTAGLLMMTSVLSGAVLAWPRTRERLRRLLAVSWRANAARVALDLHRAGGVLIGAVLLLSTLTGFTLVYLNYVREAVGLLSRVEPFPVLPWRPADGSEPLTLAEQAARIGSTWPGHRIVELRLSERGLTGTLFWLRAEGDVHAMGDTIAWLHPVTGELLAERSPRTRSAGESLMHWLLPLHVGSAFGTAGLVAMAIGGLLPLLLTVTGLWVWWRKRGAEQAAQQAGRQHRVGPAD